MYPRYVPRSTITFDPTVHDCPCDDKSPETHMEVFLSVNRHKDSFKLVRLTLDYGTNLISIMPASPPSERRPLEKQSLPNLF